MHFPQASLNACLFHFDQNMLKHSRYPSNFYQDDEGRIIINTLKGLPFLPLVDVLDGWRELKVEIISYFGEHSNTFIKYFENYYLEMSNDSYLMEIWNCSYRGCPHYAWWRRASRRGPSGVVCLDKWAMRRDYSRLQA